MLDAETKRRIDTCRDILVGKVPDPKSQVEQITIALIYKFMDDMDAEAEELGGDPGGAANALGLDLVVPTPAQRREGKVDQAQQTLETVVAQYPGSDAARTAQQAADALGVAGAITPVPGGVGPMTIACLLANTLTACCRIVRLSPWINRSLAPIRVC